MISGTFVSNTGLPYVSVLLEDSHGFLEISFVVLYQFFMLYYIFIKLYTCTDFCEHKVGDQDFFLGVGLEFARGPRKPT